MNLELWDICERRHRGNSESAKAQAQRRHKSAEQRARVLAAIESAGASGLTVDELAARWGVGANVVSGRFSELKAADRIVKHGTRKTRAGNSAGVFVVRLTPQ